jgi:hypothetical protein
MTLSNVNNPIVTDTKDSEEGKNPKNSKV